MGICVEIVLVEHKHMTEKQMLALTPEPLFEINLFENKVCLLCVAKPATSILWSPITNKQIVPLCENCAKEWDFYRYQVLKRIKLGKTIWRLVKYKLFHFSIPFFEMINHLLTLGSWADKMNKLKRRKV